MLGTTTGTISGVNTSCSPGHCEASGSMLWERVELSGWPHISLVGDFSRLWEHSKVSALFS